MFQILPFDPLLSDMHNGVSVECISNPVKSNFVENEEQNAQKVKWIKENKDSFVNAIDLNTVLLLEENISKVSSLGTVNINQSTVDTLFEDFNKILLDADSNASMLFTVKHGKRS